MRFHRCLTLETLARVVADVALVNASYLAALIIRLLWRIGTLPDYSAHHGLQEAVQTYALTAWLLTLICLAAYGLSGFYSRGRYYAGRFKAVIILQAVSISYLLFGLAMYVYVTRRWPGDTPGLALVLAWFLTLVLTVGSRLWSVLWRQMIEREAPVRRLEQDGRIHRVLVVGGAGYIGSVLCRQLLQQGYSVRVLDALLYGREPVAELLSHRRFELVQGDSRDIGDVFRAMLDVDAVVHLGELVGDLACALDERLTLEINLAATRMLAEAARGCGIKRFIYASSCSVYGAGSQVLDERSALNPVSLYARAKIGSEQALGDLARPSFRPVILRFATVYGLSPRPRFDLVVNLLTARAVCEGELTILGGGQWRPFVHVADVARAIVLCLEAPLALVEGQTFNVGSDEQNLTISQVGDLIQGLIPGARLSRREQDADQRDYHVSFGRIRRELGFLPAHTLSEGVREIEEALRTGQIGDYRDKRYSNYQLLSDPNQRSLVAARHINDLYAAPGPG
ncbi:MAG TPA: NAD-dependent epimerase/dehydratase family protein, partial [Anaerolineae bacterium]|nr:NAD-dependent epimerase/dehydratase family protein [Anaerolineae bacterium]